MHCVCTWDIIPGTWQLVPGTRKQVPDTCCLSHGTWHPDTSYLVSGAWYICLPKLQNYISIHGSNTCKLCFWSDDLLVINARGNNTCQPKHKNTNESMCICPTNHNRQIQCYDLGWNGLTTSLQKYSFQQLPTSPSTMWATNYNTIRVHKVMTNEM